MTVIQKITYANNVTKEVVGIRTISIVRNNIPSGITTSAFTEKGAILVGTGSGSYVAFPPGEDGKFLQYDSNEPSGMKSGVPTLEVEDTTNYALNGGFDFAQSQMDETTLTTIADGGYGPDQWKSYRENADLQYRRVDASGEGSLNSPFYGEYKKITNAGKILICQPIEYLNTLRFRGRTVSFQLKMKASSAKTMKIAIMELQTGGTADTIPAVVSSWNADTTDPTFGTNLAVIASPTSCSVTSSWQTFTFAGTFPISSKNLLLVVWSDADMAVNDTLHMAEAGLYYGATARSWYPRQIGDELQLLQRYYYLLAKGDNKALCGAAVFFTTQAAGVVQFKVSMRIGPNIDSQSGTNYYKLFRNGAEDFFDSLNILYSHANACEIIHTGDISSTAGHAGEFRTAHASAKVGFSARL